MKLIENFSIYLKGKTVEILEKAPKVRRLCWGIVSALILWSLSPIVVALINKLL